MPALITNIYDSAFWLGGNSSSFSSAFFRPFAYFSKHYFAVFALMPLYPVFFLFIDPGFLNADPLGVDAILCSNAFLILSWCLPIVFFYYPYYVSNYFAWSPLWRQF